MTESEMKAFIKENAKYLRQPLTNDLYIAGLIDTHTMYMEAKFSVLAYQIKNNEITQSEIKKEKKALMDDFAISQATFYRYLKDSLIVLKDFHLFMLLVTTGKKTLAKALLNGTQDTYSTIADYINKNEFRDNSSVHTDYRYQFEPPLTSKYCYKLWHQMTKKCYVPTTAKYNYKIYLRHIEKIDNSYHIKVSYEQPKSTNAQDDTHNISDTTWEIKNKNYLSEIGKRIGTLISVKVLDETEMNLIVKNETGDKKITRYLELMGLRNIHLRLEQ